METHTILSTSFNKRTDFLWKRKKSFEMIKLLGGQHVSSFVWLTSSCIGKAIYFTQSDKQSKAQRTN